MKTLMTLLLLVGCAGAQDATTVITDGNLSWECGQRPVVGCVAGGSPPRIYDGEKWIPINEPMDVPAVTIKTQITAGFKGQVPPFGCGGKWVEYDKGIWKCEYTGCADRRRVLLTSEDGKKHCILFSASGQ